MTLEAESTPNDFRSRDSRGWALAFFVSLVTSLLIVAPFFWLGSASGHDFEFHVASWLDVAGQWKEGILFPRWMEWANHGFGEPRFIFYPPLSWLLAPALSWIAPWNFVPALFIIFTQTLAGLSAFALARRVLPKAAALFAAFCYAANPDALLIVYMRSDFAELLACAFFPLLFLFAFEIGDVLEYGSRPRGRSIVFFSLVFACVWLSNAPAGVMASYSVALLFAWSAISQKSRKIAIEGAGGIILGLGLASFYLLPAAYEQRWINIGQVLSAGLLPAENFLYTATNDPEHTFFNWIASTCAVAMILVSGFGALAARRQASVNKGDTTVEASTKMWVTLLLLSAAATFLMIRPSFLFWQLLPKLRFVQFPWRWMSILAVPFFYFAGAALSRRRLRWIWCASVVAILAGMAMFMVCNTWWEADDVPTLRAAITNGTGFDGTDEYDPLADDHYNLATVAPRAAVLPASEDEETKPNAVVAIDRWTAVDRALRVKAQTPLRLALRLVNYPAWRISVNGAPAAPSLAEGTAQVIVNLSAGESVVEAHFGKTTDRWWGLILSGLSLALGLSIWVRKAG
jgi:uncharacterized membrane protein